MEKTGKVLSNKTVKITALILTIVCFLTAIAGLNKPHLNPFKGTLDMKYPVGVAYSDKGMAVIDNQNRRLLILSPEHELKAVVDTSMSGSPVDKIWSVSMNGDRIFVIGITLFNKGAYISSESVIEYDMRGRQVQTLFRQSYTEDEKVNREHFLHLMAEDDGIYLTLRDDKALSLLRIGEKTEEVGQWTLPETIYFGGYFPLIKYGIAVGRSQNCYYLEEDGSVAPVTFMGFLCDLFKYFNIPDDTVDISIFEDCYCAPSIAVAADGVARYYCVVSPKDQLLLVLSNDTSELIDIASIEYSTAMTLKTVGYWLAIVFICVEAIILLIWLMFKKLKGQGRPALLIVAVVVLISLFYTRQLQNVSEKSYNNALVTQTKQFSYIISKSCGDIFAKIRSEGIEAYCTDVGNQSDIDEFRSVLKAMCDANGSEQSCYAACYLYDPSGALYTFTDSCNSEMSGQRIDLTEDVEQLLGESRHEPITVELYSETMVYDCDYIYDSDSNIVGVLFISGLRGNLHYVLLQNVIDTTVNLTALLIGIYMLVTLFRSFSADIKRRKSREPSDVQGKSLDMAGIFSFAHGIISSLDSVIVVYTARSLCAGMDTATMALCVALPMTLTTVGCVLGISSTSLLCRLLGDRKSAVISTVLTVAAMLVAAYAITVRNIYLYSLGKLIGGIFFGGILYVMRQTIPHRSKSEADRQSVLASVQRCTVASAIISALIGGYVSQYLSYRAIYLLGAGLCILFIALCLMCFARSGNDEKTDEACDKRPVNRAEYLKLFFRGPGLMYLLFYSLPFVLVGGYKSFLFPMYTAGAGISALLLSNLSVFVRTFSFLVQGPIKKFTVRLDRNTVLVVPMLVICACLICFIISPNVYWAIATLLIYEIMVRVPSSASWLHVTELASSRDLDAKAAYSNYLSLENVVNCLQSPVMSQFVALGMNFACAAVGAVCGLMYGIFGIYNKRRTGKS